MNEQDLTMLLTETDPVPDESAVEVTRSATEMLAELRRRDGVSSRRSVRMVDAERERRPALLAVAASLVALLVAAIAIVGTGSGDAPEPAPATVPPLPSTTAAGPVADLEATIARLVDAVNRGDLDGLMAQFSSDVRATLLSGVGEPDPDTEPWYGRDDVEFYFAGLLALGTEWTDLQCAPTAALDTTPALRCTWLVIPTILQVIGEPPQPTVALVAGGEDITEFHVSTDDRRANRALDSYVTWLNRIDPGGSPPAAATPDEAAELGAYRASRMPEWASFLAAHNCTYTAPCTAMPER
jgi:hypothetical protein